MTTLRQEKNADRRARGEEVAEPSSRSENLARLDRVVKRNPLAILNLGAKLLQTMLEHDLANSEDVSDVLLVVVQMQELVERKLIDIENPPEEERKSKKPNYEPPGWLVSRFDVLLSPERAKQFERLRYKLCQKHGAENDANSPNSLFNRAIELLIESE